MALQTNSRPMWKWFGFTAPAILAVFALPTSVTAQTAQARAYYIGAHLGQNNLSDWPAEVNFGGVTSRGRLGLDDGLHGGVMVGRQTENARFEVEYQQGRLDITSVSLGPVNRSEDARGKYQVLMLNAYRTFVIRPNLNAYVGAGIGWASVKLPGLPPLNGCNCFPAASEKDVAFQARVGAEYEFSLGHRLFLQYSALRLPSANSGGVPSVSYAHKNVSAITAGYRMNF